MAKSLRSIFSKRMLVLFLMGFSSGLPFLLTGSTLSAWFTEAGLTLTTIGFLGLVKMPYAWKFVWSPLLDRFTPPFLGRRRGWLVITQIVLIALLCAMSLVNPSEMTGTVAIIAFLIALSSATQDIAIDAYRREILDDEELGLGNSLAITGYRIAILFSGAFALFLADHIPWGTVYIVMGAGMAVGLLTTFWADEPKLEAPPPRNIKESVILPFLDFFKRRGALIILAFIFFYKIGDVMASIMTTPFYLKIGFTKTDVAAVAKVFGIWATIVGGLIGGSLILKMGIRRSLWIFGILQAISTAGFAVLANVGASIPWLTAVISFENLSSGLGTAAFVAFMASLTNKRFTATQYALLSSFMAIPNTLMSPVAGWMADTSGWQTFFTICALAAVPGLALIPVLSKMAPEQKTSTPEAA